MSYVLRKRRVGSKRRAVGLDTPPVILVSTLRGNIKSVRVSSANTRTLPQVKSVGRV